MKWDDEEAIMDLNGYKQKQKEMETLERWGWEEYLEVLQNS